MNIILFAHPSFANLKSMFRFANMLTDGMQQRGHSVEVWSPHAQFFKIPVHKTLRKWLGYIDQYIIFPYQVRNRIRHCPPNTLFVITDNALGPWVPLIADLPHVVHCNDFLAQRSALGEIVENPTSWTGKQYQAFIRRGYQKGRNFISLSNKTKSDLQNLLTVRASESEVIYLGLNSIFQPGDPYALRTLLSKKIGIDLSKGYLLHVGGNQWYKNRVGVIDIYDAVRTINKYQLPLLMIGETPSREVEERHLHSPFKESIHLLTDVDDKFVQQAYAGASIFLFPSLNEGFGWPIAEAMAAGCPVITTGEPPMTEVASDAGFLIPRRPQDKTKVMEWAIDTAKLVNKILDFSIEERRTVVEAGLRNVSRFNSQQYLENIEKVYKRVLRNYNKSL